MDSSIYKKIIDYLLEIISRNASIPNYKLPSERMLSANFDASRKPVRHAYEELIERGYVTNIHGRGYFIRSDIKTDDLLTAFQKNMKVALVMPSLLSRYSHAILSGVSDFCTNNHVELAIHVSDNSPEKEASLLRSIPHSGAMGIILFPSDSDFPSHNELIKLCVRKYPVVLVDRSLPNIHASFVSSDDHQAMVDAVRFLHQRNYMNPVYVTPPAGLATSIDSRINGYTHGLLKFYKMATPRNLLKLDDNRRQQKDTVLRYLQKYPDTDVMIVQGSQRNPVISAIQELGIQNLKLVIFDDELSHAERDLLKPIFILQDGYQIGHFAAETLYNHILGDMRTIIKQLPVAIIDAEEEGIYSDVPPIQLPSTSETT